MKTSKIVSPDDLRTQESFEVLFEIKPAILKAISENMKKAGFDESKPIDVWKGQGVVIDGHTRLKAARAAGLAKVAIFEHDFADELAAVEYAAHNQGNRRNLTDAGLLRCMEMLDRRGKQGEGQERDERGRMKPKAPNGAKGKSSETTAARFGVSPRKVERARTVMKKASGEARQAISDKKKSINKVYQELTGSEPTNRQVTGSICRKIRANLDKTKAEDGYTAALHAIKQDYAQTLNDWCEENMGAGDEGDYDA